MKKILFALLALAIFVTGCVSTKTYEQVVSEAEARRTKIENLERENMALGEELSALKKELEDLRAENEKLNASNIAKDEEITALKSKIETMGVEIGNLKAENEKLEGDKAALEEKIVEMSREIQGLREEVERLRVKAGELSAEKEREIANLKKTYEDLVKEMKGEIEKGEIKITRVLNKLSVKLVEKVLFDSGHAEIKPEGKAVLKRVAAILKNVKDKEIRIEGHTDNVPIGPKIKDKFPTNWELSTARATTVVRYLIEEGGIDPRFLSAVGYSKYRPVASNDSPEGRALNRRIEIVLVPKDIDRVLEELKK